MAVETGTGASASEPTGGRLVVCFIVFLLFFRSPSADRSDRHQSSLRARCSRRWRRKVRHPKCVEVGLRRRCWADVVLEFYGNQRQCPVGEALSRLNERHTLVIKLMQSLVRNAWHQRPSAARYKAIYQNYVYLPQKAVSVPGTLRSAVLPWFHWRPSYPLQLWLADSTVLSYPHGSLVSLIGPPKSARQA